MEHLNFCRQVTKQYAEFVHIPGVDSISKARMAHVLDLAAASQKFILPDGGLLIDDPELRAIDESIPLRLPHKFIALEFLHADDEDRQDTLTKRIAFARERDGFVHLSGCAFMREDDMWVWMPECAIPMTDYLVRNEQSKAATVKFRPLAPDANDPALYHLLLKVLMCFLNALQCSNVHIERSAARKQAKKLKTALPFDSYHVLTIDVVRKAGVAESSRAGIGHRSPREHLRRGHVVRPEGRKPYWRNATVVNAAKGAGHIEKTYKLRSQPSAH